MKLISFLKTTTFIASFVLVATSCSKEDSLGESRLSLEEAPKTELDQWIDANYRIPYNIRATYKWDQAMGNYDKLLYPPKLESVKPALEMVKKIWLDTYTEVGGASFVKKISPRELHIVGSYNVNNNGTIVLGEAGSGARITLFNADFVDRSKLDDIRQFVHTIHHEYVHILNQTKPYDKQAWSTITPGKYTSTWYLITDVTESHELGFVTNYARLNVDEDIAETASYILMHTKVEYETFMAGLSVTARALVQRKVDIVVEYYKSAFDMDFFELRDVAERNTIDAISN
ncbi:substrate import-associated zinc metallohydrolase lipoprotein [Flavobacterium sp. JP2137]|uniref:substrate import-associated zinc metallohydrolase lipoprotein n=1 Tax=Flavobacterium sp. JP2137 TaxID=3414510 RepID=UPI003D2FE98D